MSKRNKKEYAFPKMIKYFKNIKKELILFTIILAVSVSVDQIESFNNEKAYSLDDFVIKPYVDITSAKEELINSFKNMILDWYNNTHKKPYKDIDEVRDFFDDTFPQLYKRLGKPDYVSFEEKKATWGKTVCFEVENDKLMLNIEK